MAQGMKTGGRKRGTKNKKTVLLEQKGRKALAKVLGADASEGDAHSLLVAIYKDGSMPIGLRLDAAKAAVRYEKPALAAIEHSGSLQTKPAHLMTDDELAAIAAGGLSSSNQAPVDPKSSTDRSYRT
jgi:hypothetical protein